MDFEISVEISVNVSEVLLSLLRDIYIYIYTHTHIYIYIVVREFQQKMHEMSNIRNTHTKKMNTLSISNHNSFHLAKHTECCHQRQ